MLGLERNVCWAADGDDPVSEVGDGVGVTVTFAASLSKSLPEAEARHLEIMELALGDQISCLFKSWTLDAPKAGCRTHVPVTAGVPTPDRGDAKGGAAAGEGVDALPPLPG